MKTRIIPEDPLGFIQQCVKQRSIRWTYHVNMRLQGRSISREAILASCASYEIVEAYPEDKYLPSYLVFATYQGNVFHVLFATDVAEDHVRVVTAYVPDPDEWEQDLKKRKQHQ